MRTMFNRSLIALILVASLSNIACTDPQLTQLARALDDTAKGMASLQKVVITANTQGLIKDEQTRAILDICLKINLGGKQAVLMTRNLHNLSATDKASVLGVLKPVIQAVADGAASTLTGDISEPTRTNILVAMSTIMFALNTVQTILGGQ